MDDGLRSPCFGRHFRIGRRNSRFLQLTGHACWQGEAQGPKVPRDAHVWFSGLKNRSSTVDSVRSQLSLLRVRCPMRSTVPKSNDFDPHYPNRSRSPPDSIVVRPERWLSTPNAEGIWATTLSMSLRLSGKMVGRPRICPPSRSWGRNVDRGKGWRNLGSTFSGMRGDEFLRCRHQKENCWDSRKPVLCSWTHQVKCSRGRYIRRRDTRSQTTRIIRGVRLVTPRSGIRPGICLKNSHRVCGTGVVAQPYFAPSDCCARSGAPRRSLLATRVNRRLRRNKYRVWMARTGRCEDSDSWKLKRWDLITIGIIIVMWKSTPSADVTRCRWRSSALRRFELSVSRRRETRCPACFYPGSRTHSYRYM